MVVQYSGFYILDSFRHVDWIEFLIETEAIIWCPSRFQSVLKFFNINTKLLRKIFNFVVKCYQYMDDAQIYSSIAVSDNVYLHLVITGE